MSEVFGAGAVAAFAALGPEAHPGAARRRAALAVLDTLGTMVAGCETSAARAARTAALPQASDAERAILAQRGEAGPIPAALANGVAASALDLDDGHTLGGSIHPGAAIVPSLLSVARPEDLLDDLVVANLVAYEVAIRAGFLLWPADHSHQAHMAGTPAAIGGAIGCARLRGLDEAGLRRALEIGAAHAPVAALQFPHVKESLGWAAATAAASALLAGAGFKQSGRTGDGAYAYRDHPPTPFDRPGSKVDFVSSLGAAYEIERTYFKPYGACRFVHTAADAFRAIVAESEIAAADIERIEVHTHREAAYLKSPAPSTIEEGQYSFPFFLSLLAHAPGAFPLRVTAADLEDAEVVDLASRVRVGHDPQLDRHYPENYPSRVRVEARDGGGWEHEEVVAWGAPEKPLDEAELRRKFIALTEPALGDRGERLWALFDAPDRAQVGEVLELLAA